MGRTQRRPPLGDRGSSSLVARLVMIVRALAIGAATVATVASVAAASPAGGTKKIAVVHVGPHKTGTTSIQSSTRIYKDAFRADGYLVVDFDPEAGLRNMTPGHLDRRPTQVIAYCSCRHNPNATEEEVTEGPECDEGQYRRIRDALSDETNPIRNYNLIFSMEDLDNPCVDVGSIKDLLVPHWDVRIVVGYRRFFEWAASYYYQQNRVDARLDGRRRGRGASWPAARNATPVNVRTWWTEERALSQYEERRYSTAVFGRYRDALGDDKVSILNVHEEQEVFESDGGGLVENFFCHQVPNATNACRELRTYDPARDENPNPNRGGSTAYDEVAVAAYLSGLVDCYRGDGDGESGCDGTTSVSRPELREWIRLRQEEMMNLTAGDLPMDCMSDDRDDPQLRLFLDLSLRAERSLTPSFHDGPHGERELREEFERAAASKLCAVDTGAILRDAGWIAFFRSTTKRRPSSSPLQLIEQESSSRSSNVHEDIGSWDLPRTATDGCWPMIVVAVGITSFFLGCVFATCFGGSLKRIRGRHGRSMLYPLYPPRRGEQGRKPAGTGCGKT